MGTARVIKRGPGDYLIKTNLPPDQLNTVGLAIFDIWLQFAMGALTLPGPSRKVSGNQNQWRTDVGQRKLNDPSGRYAASLQYQQDDDTTITIFADSAIAPEADIIERGRRRFDLKSVFQKGRSYPMHRGMAGRGTVGQSPTMRSTMWGEFKSNTMSGEATVGDAADSWILPAMAPYAPAQILAQLAAGMARE